MVDEEGRLRGLIPPRRMLAVLLEEHEEDMLSILIYFGVATALT